MQIKFNMCKSNPLSHLTNEKFKKDLQMNLKDLPLNYENENANWGFKMAFSSNFHHVHSNLLPLPYNQELKLVFAQIDAFIQISWTMLLNKQFENNNVKLAFNYHALLFHKQCLKPKLMPCIHSNFLDYDVKQTT